MNLTLKPQKATLPGWTVRPARNGDEDGILRLLNQVYHPWGSAALLTWKYSYHPDGLDLPAWVAEYGGEIIAHYGMWPLQAVLNGETVPAAQSIDAGVSPNFRRQGILSTIEQEILDQAARCGATLIYAFPGLRSVAMHDRIGYSPFAFVPEMTRLLQPGRALKQALHNLPGELSALGRAASGGAKDLDSSSILRLARLRFCLLFLLSSCTDIGLSRRPPSCSTTIDICKDRFFSAEHDGFFKEIRKQAGIYLLKDSRYLNWRYPSKPGGQYIILAARSRSVLTGYLVLGRSRPGRWVICELAALPDQAPVLDALVARACQEAISAGALSLTAWSNPGSHVFRPLLNCGFISLHRLNHLGTRYRSFRKFLYSIILYVRHLSPPVREQVLSAIGKWPISMGDSDLV